jgi:DNA-binding beta-propeller fold protein YncE
VSATYNGQIRGIQPPTDATKNTRQISVTIGGGSNSSDFTVPGLYPVAIKNATDATKMAVANLAVQPNYNSGSSITKVIDLTTADGIGTSPSDVAINPATGMAVVANTGSNSISLIDLTAGTPNVVAQICTADRNVPLPCTALPASGPTSVAVDYVRNIALVVNATSKTIAVVDLSPTNRAVTSVISVNLNSVPTAAADTPGAVGINPVTGQALIAMQRSNSGFGAGYGVLMYMDPTPHIAGVVSISSGQKTRVAIEPHLNWAIATPGGLGSVGIVDLSQQATNTITSVSRTSNVVQVTVQLDASTPPLAIQQSDAVWIQGVAVSVNGTPDTTLNGIFTVTAIGPTSAQFSYTQTGSLQPDFASTPTGGTISYSQPVSTVGVPLGVQGIGINPETQQAVLVDPKTGGVVSIFSLIDQTVSPLTMKTNGVADKNGPTAVAYNPLTNTAVAVDFVSGALSVIDPEAPRRLNDGNLSFGLNGPVAVAVDPGTNLAVVANQTNNTVSILNLGAIKPFSITETNPKTFVTNSSINSPSNPSEQTLTVYGKGLTCASGSTNLTVRLDGFGLRTFCAVDGDRQLTAKVPPNLLLSARRFALDVEDGSGNVTNAEDLTVEQSVDLSSSACPAPEPSGVSVDPQQNIAAVTLFGCDSVALIDMAKGTGNTAKVGSKPIGVAVIPRLQLFVVANNGSGNATILDESGNVKNTLTTGTGSMGAAADEATGEVAIANSVANTVTVVNAVTGGTSTISTGQRPIAVAFNYVNHQLAVAASSGNSVGISGGAGGSVTQAFSVSAPTSVIYDPVPTDCGSNSNGATTNTTGCFIVNSSTGNSVNVIDPVSSVQIAFRIGINPTAIAYNYRTSTLVSTNTGSHTVTVADFLGQKIRAVLTLPPAISTNSNLALSLSIAGAFQYALDIHPFTNVAVIADTANGRVLFVPLPR